MYVYIHIIYIYQSIETIQSKIKNKNDLFFVHIGWTSRAPISPSFLPVRNSHRLDDRNSFKQWILLNPYGIGLMSLSLIWKPMGSWGPAHPSEKNVRKFVASWHPMTSSHRSSPPTSMAGAASGECSEKKKLRPCHMEETALPAAESRFRGEDMGVPTWNKTVGHPPKKKALTV